MTEADPLLIEVICALSGAAVVKAYRLSPPATVADALALAAADPDFSGIDVQAAPVGIFGRLVPLGRELQPGDRIELYRALAADPKQARRQRAERVRARGPKSPKPGRAAR